MRWTSILAIYMLFWILAAFLVMPFGVRTHDEAGVEKVPGQAESAPAHFNPRQITLRATVLSLVLFALYYANYTQRWITIEDLDLTKWLGWY
jgi:predicted secreted protein